MSTAVALDTPPALSWAAPGPRRLLQLALAGVWLLDAVLQFQPYMFTKAFATQTLAPTAQGNPALIAQPITWSVHLISHHPAVWNTPFAIVQLLLAVGIAWRPTVKPALAASIVWSLAVWWLGEGLGGLLTGNASPLNGAPGAVLLYALLAVLVWPTDRTEQGFVAATPVGARAARLVWLVLWAGLGYLAVQPAGRAPQAVHDMITAMASGQPSWLAWADHRAADLTAHHGLATSITLAAALAAVGAGVYLRPVLVRWVLVAAMVISVVIWVVGENLGMAFGGQATDPNSGPLLALLALAFWPLAASAQEPEVRS